MAIDKALGQAPLGLDLEEMEDEPALEIEIEDPEAVRIGIDGMPILEIEAEEDEDGVTVHTDTAFLPVRRSQR